MEQRARSYASSSLISFPSIPSNDDVEILDFSNNPLSSFSGLPTLSNLHTLIFDNTHLKSFQGARMEPNLKCISLLNTPLLQYLYLDLMTIIVFGNSVVKIEDVAELGTNLDRVLDGGAKFEPIEKFTQNKEL